MVTHNPTDAELFQQFLAEQVVSSGRHMAPEELVRLWRERQREHENSNTAIREGIADMDAGRLYPFNEVNDEIRRAHGWST